MTAELVAIRVTTGSPYSSSSDTKGIGVWAEHFTELRIPKLFDLRVRSVRAGRRYPL